MGLLDGNSQNFVTIALTVMMLLIIETSYPKSGCLGIYDITIGLKTQPSQAFLDLGFCGSLREIESIITVIYRSVSMLFPQVLSTESQVMASLSWKLYPSELTFCIAVDILIYMN